MATRIRTLETIVRSDRSLSLPANMVLTLSDDALATALITAGKAVAVADATTAVTLFGSDWYEMHKVSTGPVTA